MCECAACTYVCAPWGREELVRSPGSGVTDRCELSCDCWEASPGAVQSGRRSYLLGQHNCYHNCCFHLLSLCMCMHGSVWGQRTTFTELFLALYRSPALGIKLRLPGAHSKHLYSPARHSLRPGVALALTSMRQHFLVGLDDGHVHSLLSLSCSEHPPAMAVFSSHVPHATPAQPFSCLTGPQAFCSGQII